MKNLNFKIDKSRCVQCGRCIKDCICSVLEFGEDNIPKVAQDGENRCIGCQHCFAVCPTGAISVFGNNPDEAPAIPKEYPSEEILKLIQSRRSVRKYKQENLSKAKWNKIKEMLPYIPTGVNDHRLLFAFIDDIDAMARFKRKTYDLLKKLFSQENVPQEFAGLMAFKNPIMNGEDVIFRNAPHLAVVCSPNDAPCANIDGVIALSYLELYAQSMGIGTVWCGLSYYCLSAFPELVKELKIPEGYKPVYCMLLGPSDIQYKRIVKPKEYKIITYCKTLAKIEAFCQKVKTQLSELMK